MKPGGANLVHPDALNLKRILCIGAPNTWRPSSISIKQSILLQFGGNIIRINMYFDDIKDH